MNGVAVSGTKRRVVLLAIVAVALGIVSAFVLLAERWRAWEPRGKSAKEIEWIAISPGGERVFGFGDDGMFQVEVENGLDRLLGPRRVNIKRNALLTATLPGARDALVGTDEALVVRDLDGEREDRLVLAQSGLEAVAVTSDGRRYAFCTREGLSLGDVAGGRFAGPFSMETLENPAFARLLWTPDGTRVAIWGPRGGAAVHIADRSGPVRALGGREIVSVAFAGTDTVLVVGAEEVRAYSLETGELVYARPHDVARYAFASATGLLAHMDPDGVVTVREIATGRRLRATWPESPKASVIAISTDGSTLAIGRVDGSIEVHGLGP